MQLTSIKAPSLATAERFADHFSALGVDEVVTTSPDTLTLKFDQQSGFEFAVASMAIKNVVDGAKLVLEVADGAALPRMLPSARYVIPTLEKLPGVKQVVSTDALPPQVVVFAQDRPSASALSALLNPTYADGSKVGVTYTDSAPNE